MSFKHWKNYRENSRLILQSLNNPLKKPQNLRLKDDLERQFYDQEAEQHLNNFDEKLYAYDPNEKMPLTHRYFYSLLEKVRDKEILDICCGYGFTSVKLAMNGAAVTGIDISPKMIELAKRNAEFNRIGDRVNFVEMSAQQLEFKDSTFDFVVGFGALHHLNVELAGKEISRVLRPDGRAIFIEPRIPLQVFILIRSVFPQKCFESPGGAQLTDKEIKIFGRHFTSSNSTYFILLKKLARFPILKHYGDLLENWDWRLVNRLPLLKRLCWAFVLDFKK